MAPILPLQEHSAIGSVSAERGSTGHNNCPDGIELEDAGTSS
ncbi:hypothetical protein ACFYO0_34645 [Streptomyces sp. NPDC006365]